jgi:MSHA biogenesis protein MshM
MYLEHFQLEELPFRLTPQLSARFDEPSQAEALQTLLIALDQGEGFIKVSAEVGLGKTFLCRLLLEALQPPFITAWIPDPHLSPSALRRAVAEDFGLSLPSRATRHDLHQALQRHLTELVASGKRPVLLIDEAQALPGSALETVRLLTNLETEQRKLLQVVLFGQPELDHRLASNDFRQLRQRITFSAQLRPMRPDTVAAYVQHRLHSAGGRPDLFTQAGLRRLARASEGVPRLVNVLAHKALMSAYGRGQARAGWRDVGRAISDTEATTGGWNWSQAVPAMRLTVFGLVALATFLAVDAWWGGGP